MFKFLKGLFKPKETEETVATDNLLFWFDKKAKERLSKVEGEIDIFFQGVENRKKQLYERLVTLEKAEIKEPDKIEDRIRNLVLGNRQNYLRVLRIFLDELEVPEEKSLGQSMKLNEFLKEKLDELAKNTAKSYSASQHLFFEEVQAVSKGLKDLLDLSKNFERVMERNKLNDLEKARQLIDLLSVKINEKNKLKEALDFKKAKLEHLLANKRKKQGEVEALEQGEDYRDYLGLKEEREKIESQIRENQSKFLEIFAQLERPLRKYEHVAASNQEWIKNYLENPLTVFFKDENLVFLDILQKVRENLAREDLDLKDSKREKSLEVIDSVDRVRLGRIQERDKQLKEEKSIAAKKIDNSAVYGKLSDARYKLEHFDTQIADLEQEIKEVEEAFSKIDLEQIKEKIKEKVLEVFRVRLEIC